VTDIRARMSRPRADTMEVSDLLEEARRGKFELPDFQRGMQWQKEDRIKLFDSIYRGFPIGDILLWEPDSRRAGEIRFGPFEPAHRHDHPWLIVDGQQRLATLFGSLLLPDRDPAGDEDLDNWRLAFDTDTGSIVDLPPSAPPHLLPLPIAIDTSRYLRWARGLPDERRELRTAAADDFSKALRTYRIPFYVVRTDDRKVLEEVFERVNNTGRRLKRRDVFDALFAGGEEHEDRKKLEVVATELETKGFGRLKPEWLLQGIKVMVGMDPAGDFSVGLRKADEADRARGAPQRTRRALETIYPRLKQAGERTIEALVAAGIRRIEALPYALILPVLMHFYDRFPEPLSDEDEAEVRRWIWWVAAVGARGQNRSTWMRANAQMIWEGHNPGDALLRLLFTRHARTPGPGRRFLEKRHDWRSGETRLVALALFDLGPRDLETGAPIDVWQELSRRGDKIFSRIVPEGASSSSSTGRIITPSGARHTLNLKAIAQRAEQPSAETLASQAIPVEAWHALRDGEEWLFQVRRRQRMTEVIDSFLSTRATDEDLPF
jgi:hypothetical protein